MKKNLGNLITKGTVYIDCLMTGKQIKEIIAMKSNDSKKAFYSKFKNNLQSPNSHISKLQVL